MWRVFRSSGKYFIAGRKFLSCLMRETASVGERRGGGRGGILFCSICYCNYIICRMWWKGWADEFLMRKYRARMSL